MNDLQERILSLEQRVSDLEKLLELREFLPISDASKILGIDHTTLYKWVRHARINPRTSPYKEGIDFLTQKNRRILINPSQWRESSINKAGTRQ